MKLLPLTLVLVLTLCTCKKKVPDNTQADKDNGGSPVIEFSHMEHDFGRIEEGEIVACVFTFQNTGEADLLITSATTSCGCTVPEYDDKPVPPGGNGKVEVVFDSSFRNGLQNKTIAIRSNAKQPVVILKIKADVITKK
ncbi:MAG TPA: DUF1573 domain-containing protein [Bacteroidetes bacterium]|nr:DUF1573 domain-containing protein [Bacteroidota bacterium]